MVKYSRGNTSKRCSEGIANSARRLLTRAICGRLIVITQIFVFAGLIGTRDTLRWFALLPNFLELKNYGEVFERISDVFNLPSQRN